MTDSTPASHGHDPAHAHAHAHSHADAHSHAPSAEALAHDPRARRALLLALCAGLVVLAVEVVAGIAYGSLALLGDAAHMVTDVGAYGIALWAAHVARRPPSATRTFGHGRVEILAALVNGATLLAASAWIIVEAVRRLVDPPIVDGAGMTVFAALGLVANVVVLTVLWRSGSASLNIRAAVLHAAGDLLGSGAAVVAGLLVALTGFQRADPIASLLITLLIVIGSWRLVRSSADILLDAAPVGVDADTIAASLMSVAGVLEVHDVHVWTMAPGMHAASAHLRVARTVDPSITLDALQSALAADHAIAHSTLQLRVDRGTVPIESVGLMTVPEAIEWATDHVAAAHPDLGRSVIAAAAGAAALGMQGRDRVSPVSLARQTLTALGR